MLKAKEYGLPLKLSKDNIIFQVLKRILRLLSKKQFQENLLTRFNDNV
jgi:hypothetical protein